jgi:hypothetical protein
VHGRACIREMVEGWITVAETCQECRPLAVAALEQLLPHGSRQGQEIVRERGSGSGL